MNSIVSSPTLMLVCYCALALFAALTGGALPTLFKLTHTRLQIAISFVGGLMLGLSLLGMMPHALHQIGSIQPTVAWLLVGFLGMFLLQRFLPFHHHDVPEGSPLEPCGHPHSLAERSARSLSWAGVALGLSLHSVFDGLAMAAAVAAGDQTNSGALGLGTALAVILHKPFGALAISTLMVASHTTRNFQRLVILAFALVTPLGALLFFLGAGHLAHSHPAWVGAALAFCAGTFLCIACADLLPELQFHSHDRVKLSLALLAGIGVAVLIARFGHVDHKHESERPMAKVALGMNVPTFTFVTDGGTNYGALRYIHATNATDLAFDVRAASELGGASENGTNLTSVISGGGLETVTVRDSLPKEATPHRF